MPLKAWMPPAVAPRSLPDWVSTTGERVAVRTSLAMAFPLFAPMHRRRQHAQDFPHHRRTDQRGIARRVEGRRHLDDIAADEVKPVEQAKHPLRLGGREAADLRRAGSRRVDRIEPVDIEADIGRAGADDTARLINDSFGAEAEKLLDMDDADAD